MISKATLLIGGDCGPTHGPKDGFPVEGYTELVLPTLAAADMRFINCMRTYSDRTVRIGAHAVDKTHISRGEGWQDELRIPFDREAVFRSVRGPAVTADQ